MPESLGTLELLATKVAEILQSLEDRLSLSEVSDLLRELGIDFPLDPASQSGLVQALEAAVENSANLGSLAAELAFAVEAEDFQAVLQKLKGLVEGIGDLLGQTKAVATELKNLAGSLGLPANEVSAFADAFPRRLRDYLIITALERFVGLVESLEFLGAVVRREEPMISADPDPPVFVRKTLNPAKILSFVRSPKNHFGDLYDWGKPGFDGLVLLQTLNRLLVQAGVPAFLDTSTDPPRLDIVVAEVTPKIEGSTRGLALSNKTLLQLAPSLAVDGETLQFEFTSDLDIPVGAVVTIFPDGNLELAVAGTPKGGELKLALEFKSPEANGPVILFGQSKGTRLQASRFGTVAQLKFALEPGLADLAGSFLIEAFIQGGEFIGNSSDGDSFVRHLVPGDRFSAEFDVRVGVSSATGFYFQGSSALALTMPVHRSVGPVEIRSVTLSTVPGAADLPISVGATLKATLGPLTALVQDIGVTTSISFPDEGGNLGALDCDVSFKPPNGVGLSVDGGGFKGGGFLDFDPEQARYSGMLELEYADRLSLKAIGLLTTRLPGGEPGFSLLIVISAEFAPVQLGFGFTLNGVGGLLGLNRTVKAERLRAGLRDNTLGSVLFPHDIVANADRIISDLRQVFPPQAGRFVFGPMAKIGWGTPTLLTIDLGLLLEVPDPVRLLILGVLRGTLPDERKQLLRLQVNFLGEIDFEREQLAFDASLFDSRLLVYALSGDMAVRLSWGADPNFLLTVGGFHPAYEPPAMNLPVLRRLTVQLLEGNNPRLRLETYFAVTSNTVQFGARVELYAAAGSFNVYGFLSFDVLFQFNPFHFLADVSAMLDLRVGSSSIAGIKLELDLEGPTPWKVKGTATLRLCWFLKVKVRFSKSFGESRDTSLPDLEVLPLLLEALSAPGNWEGELPARGHRLTSLKDTADIGSILVHPSGTLRISQKVVPLNLRIDRLGSQRPSDARDFSIGAVELGGEPAAGTPPSVQESFAPAQYFDLSDAEKLSSPSFERFDSGIRVGEPEKLDTGYAAAREVKYELKYIDSARERRLAGHGDLFVVDPVAFNTWNLQGVVARSDLSFARRRKSSLAPDAVATAPEPFAIVTVDELSVFDEASVLKNEREALTRLDELTRANPALRGKLQAVPLFETKD